MRLVAWLLVAGVLLYGLWVLVLWAGQSGLAYPAAGQVPLRSAPPPDAVRSWVEFAGARVETWFLPPRGVPGAPAPLVVFGHGNGETIDDLPERFTPLRDMGLAVLLVEYPGYGRSSGKPSEESIRAAFLAAYDAVVRRPDVDSARIVAFGQSLGGGAVCTLLARRPVAGVILLSAFSSARIFARRYLAPAFLVRDVFDNVEALKGYGGPVLVLHGRADTLIPFENAEALRRAARRGRLRAYDGDHWCWESERVPLWSDVAGFLRESGIHPAARAGGSG